MPIKPEHELVLNELRIAASAITGVADALRNHFIAIAASESPAADAPSEPEAVQETSQSNEVTLAEVRAVLTEISRSGKTDQAKAIVKKHGAEKITELDSGKYAAVLADARALKDG